MSATIKDVVINIALAGVSGVTSSINQVQSQLNKLRATPGPSVQSTQSLNGGVSSSASASLLSGIIANVTSINPRANPVSHAAPTAVASHPGITAMQADIAAMLQAARQFKAALTNPAVTMPALPSISSFQNPIVVPDSQPLATQSPTSVTSTAQSAILSGIKTTFSTVGALFKQIANVVSGSSTAATIAASSASKAATVATHAGESVLNSSGLMAKLLPALNVLGSGAGNVIHQIAGAQGPNPALTSMPMFNPSVLLNPWTAVAAAAVATAVALRNLNISTRKLEEEQRADNTKFRAIQESAANAAVGRHVDQSLQLMHARPNLGEIRQVSVNQHRRSATEAEIRQEQAHSPHDFSGQQEARSRAERHQDLLERADAAKNTMDHVNQKPRELAAAQAKLNEDMKTSEEAYQRKVEAKKKEFLPPPPDTSRQTTSEWLNHNSKWAFGGTSFGNSLVDTTSDFAGKLGRTSKAFVKSAPGAIYRSAKQTLGGTSFGNSLVETTGHIAGKVIRTSSAFVKSAPGVLQSAKDSLQRTSMGNWMLNTASDFAGDFHRTRNAAFQSMSGNKTEAQRQQKNQSVQGDLKEMEVARAGEVAKQLQEQVKINKENVAVGQQQAQAAAERLNSLRAITAEARKNAEIDKETIKAGKRSAGFATPGERTRMKALSEKVKRIKGGSNEKLNQFDMEGLANAPEGTEERDFGRAEAEKRGEGIWTFKPELKKSQEKADEAQKNQDKEEPELLSHIKDLGQKNEEAGKKLIESMEKAFDSTEFFEKLRATLDSQLGVYQNNLKTMSSWFK
jgi:hypothetical protein